mgnify:FL=1
MSITDMATAINQAAQLQRSLDSLNRKYAASQSKLAIKRNEIARLTQKLEAATKQKLELLDELKWLRGEK